MNEPVSLRQLLADYQPAPAKPGALIRAAVRIADRMDFPSHQVLDLKPEEVEPGSDLFSFICDATNVNGVATPQRGSVRHLSLDEPLDCSAAYSRLVRLATALLHSLGPELTRAEALRCVGELEDLLIVAGLSRTDLEAQFHIETSDAEWAQALFR